MASLPIDVTIARRVLIVSRVGFLGGVERVILTLAAGLERSGWLPVLACPAGGTLAAAAAAQATSVVPCAFERMRITADPRDLLRYPWSWWRCALAIEQQCRAERIDLIHVHHPVTALYSLRAARRLGIPIVLHVHETLPAKRLYAVALRFVLPRVAGIVCVSKPARDLALAIGADPARVQIVHNGVDRHFQEAATSAAPAMLQEASPALHVGVFGVLEPRKAQHVLLEAAALLAPQFPEARFWLVGPISFREKQAYADRLRRMAENPVLRGRVSLTGFQSDMPAWLGAMDVVVQCSIAMESFGMALAEAMTLGRPVVASDVGGMPEVVRDGETGLIVPPNDAPALAAALAALLASPEYRVRLGAYGAVDARARFAPEVFQHNVVQAYDAAIPASTQARPTARRSMGRTPLAAMRAVLFGKRPAGEARQLRPNPGGVRPSSTATEKS